ncbi:MAG: host-nuclease inhibitor Gam family protein [Chitinophagales bacterium]|nr:host-nuclease inhibitor Gam family protein [Chitinophagales bacterium]
MATTRVKKVLNISLTKEDAEAAFAEFAKADAQQQQITAKMDVQITIIRKKYADELNKLQETKDEAFDKLQSYAENNRQEFGKKKSLEFQHGILGFRTGTPKLKTLKGFTWASVLGLLKVHLPTYVRTIEEPAKDRLLADREEPDIVQKFKEVGIYVDQDETFFVEPKKEEVTV